MRRADRLLNEQNSLSKAGASRTIAMVAVGTPVSLLVLAVFAMVITGKAGRAGYRVQPGLSPGRVGKIALQYSFAAVATVVPRSDKAKTEAIRRFMANSSLFISWMPPHLSLDASASGGMPLHPWQGECVLPAVRSLGVAFIGHSRRVAFLRQGGPIFRPRTRIFAGAKRWRQAQKPVGLAKHFERGTRDVEKIPDDSDGGRPDGERIGRGGFGAVQFRRARCVFL